MSKRVFDNNGTPRQLVEVPLPLNQNTRQSTNLFDNDFNQNRQQNQQNLPPYNNNPNNSFGNNTFGNNNPNFNNNNNNPNNGFPQQNNEFAVVPRVGPKKKTIIIKDEKGNEISRIVSSTNSRFPDNLLPQRANNIAPLPIVNPFPQQMIPLQAPPPPPLQPIGGIANSPMVLQPQFLINPAGPSMTPIPVLMSSPPYSANPFNDKAPIITQTIPEESLSSARQKRTSAHYRTLEKYIKLDFILIFCKNIFSQSKRFKDFKSTR